MRNFKLERLNEGESIIAKERGNSMSPLIKSNQKHKLEPINSDSCEVGDIVYCKVKGNFYTHLVKAKDKNKGVLIGNNRGKINGWTQKVYGKVVEVY